MRSLTFALLALLPFLGQCGVLVDCDTGIAPAVVVEVLDANTGEPAAAGALGTVRDGSYMDSLYQYRSAGGVPLALAGADERPRTYTVTIEKVGYETWAVTGVRVEDSNCHVETAFLSAELISVP
jgi:hypothetical protein